MSGFSGSQGVWCCPAVTKVPGKPVLVRWWMSVTNLPDVESRTPTEGLWVMVATVGGIGRGAAGQPPSSSGSTRAVGFLSGISQG